jgi:hypothetical protein
MSNKKEEEIPVAEVIVDGDLSLRRLQYYIALGREEERLDYKSSYDLEGRKSGKDKIEVARDVAAMYNTYGGYVVLGVEEADDGDRKYNPVGIKPEHLHGLDIDKIKSQIETFLSKRIEIKLQIHNVPKYDNKPFAFLYIPPSDREPAIFTKDGQYKGKRVNNECVFKDGDWFVRKGGSSIKASQEDWNRFASNIRRRDKEEWTEEILGVKALTERLDALIDLLAGSMTDGKKTTKRTEKQKQVVRGLAPLEQRESTFFLGEKTFYDQVLSALHDNDQFVLMWVFNNAPKTFWTDVKSVFGASSDEITKTKDNRLIPILDNLTVLGVALAQYKEKELFTELCEALYQIYRRAYDEEFPRSLETEQHFSQQWIWQEIIRRVYALGALLVRRKMYDWIPILVRQKVDWDDYWKSRFWARHTLTMLVREGRTKEEGFIQMAAAYVKNSLILNDLFLSNEDNYLNALCQFDFVQCVHAVLENKCRGDGYPSFGRFYNYRTEPIVAKIIEDRDVRAVLIPKTDDDTLAQVIMELDELAGKEFFTYAGWDTGMWHDKNIKSFLNQHKPILPNAKG